MTPLPWVTGGEERRGGLCPFWPTPVLISLQPRDFSRGKSALGEFWGGFPETIGNLLLPTSPQYVDVLYLDPGTPLHLEGGECSPSPGASGPGWHLVVSSPCFIRLAPPHPAPCPSPLGSPCGGVPEWFRYCSKLSPNAQLPGKRQLQVDCMRKIFIGSQQARKTPGIALRM